MTPSHSAADDLRREIEDLRARLAEAEQANEALTSGEVDAVHDEAHQAPVLLRKAQDALQASELRYREIFEYSSEGIFLLDVTGDGRFRISGFNPAEEKAVGLSNADVAGKFVDEAFSEAVTAQVTAKYRRCVETGIPMSYDEELDLPIGRRSFQTILVPVRNAAGRVYRIVGMASDITERKRAGEALRESEERYRVLFDGSPLPMWLYDQETLALAAVNEAAVLHYGYSRDEFLSKTMREIWHPDEVAAAMATLVASSETPWTGVRRHAKKGGGSITIEVFSHPVQIAGRRYRLSASRDITNQRELEEQLRQSQKMEAVGRLAGGVAHDFNNLLTVMLGYSDVLLQQLPAGSTSDAAKEIRIAGERAAVLTRQLLAFSRKQTLVPEVLDLGDLVNGLSSMVERLIGEDIEVSVRVAPGTGQVKADRGQLEQVVMNLAVNARDAMPKGGSLIFELENVELDGEYGATHAEVVPGRFVLLAISDTGTGMDAETQRRIFEPFFTTKEAGKGTGLGLSTVHGIVHQSGGTIGVYSEPGRGTTFKIYLPRIGGDAAISHPRSGIHRALPTGSETVLVVEDEAAIRRLTELILKKAGYTVLLAEGPADAERIIGSHPGPIHLVLTDVVMPGMRGPELAERLLRQRPDLLVLYMSGYTDDAIAHHGLLDAGTEFLEKPFTPLGLMKKIREVLGRPRS